MLSDQVPYYILDLLQQVPGVDIAGLGRFEAIFHPAVVDAAAAKIRPPHVRPDFKTEALSDDTLLESYMHYACGAEKAVAQSAIREFVRKVTEATGDGKVFTIDHFGTFSKNELDVLRFTPDWDAFNLSFRGLEVIDLAPPRLPEKKVFPETEWTPEPQAQPEKPDYSAIHEPVAEEIKLTREDLHLPAPAHEFHENTSRLWWMILISALVLITILCAYLAWDILSNRDKLNELKQTYPDTLASSRIKPSPQIQESTPIEVIPVPVEEPETTSATTPEHVRPAKPAPEENAVVPDEKGCFIVVGAFTDPANVTRMMNRLATLGFVAEEISGGRLTRVAIRSSCEKETLQKTLNEARNTVNPEAWIY